MATWNELFASGQKIARFPDPAVLDFAARIEARIADRPLRLWDLCCGAGRHTEALAAQGYDVYASDNAPAGIDLTRKLLAGRSLTAHVALADMTECPWPDVRFHGAICWNSLHHNRLSAVARTVATVRERLLGSGLFFATLISTRADSFGRGTEIEPFTFRHTDGHEAGVLHHYFDEAAVRSLLSRWEILFLAERVMHYHVRDAEAIGYAAVGHTNWIVLARRPA
jgi:SAM-dependent methyltransferase